LLAVYLYFRYEGGLQALSSLGVKHPAAAMEACALWLIAACGTELEREQWIGAWGLVMTLLLLLLLLLQSRALWLVGGLVTELECEQWIGAGNIC
jgi:hypothetical protein